MQGPAGQPGPGGQRGPNVSATIIDMPTHHVFFRIYKTVSAVIRYHQFTTSLWEAHRYVAAVFSHRQTLIPPPDELCMC